MYFKQYDGAMNNEMRNPSNSIKDFKERNKDIENNGSFCRYSPMTKNLYQRENISVLSKNINREPPPAVSRVYINDQSPVKINWRHEEMKDIRHLKHSDQSPKNKMSYQFKSKPKTSNKSRVERSYLNPTT